jgi:hypothetical protein
LSPAATMRGSFSKEVMGIFREVYPLLKFTSLQD